VKKIVEDMDATNSPGFTRQDVDEVFGIADFDLDAGDATRLAGGGGSEGHLTADWGWIPA
jgi:hypothetical protein